MPGVLLDGVEHGEDLRVRFARAPFGQHLAHELRDSGIERAGSIGGVESSRRSTCSSSANWSGENSGPESALATGLAREAGQRRGTADEKNRAEQQRATIEFSAVFRVRHKGSSEPGYRPNCTELERQTVFRIKESGAAEKGLQGRQSIAAGARPSSQMAEPTGTGGGCT